MRRKGVIFLIATVILVVVGVIAVPIVSGLILGRAVQDISDVLNPEYEQAAALSEQARNARMAQELDTHFPDAPENVRTIAATIIEGGVPDAADIEALDKQTLNASWYQPHARLFPMHGHPLLRQAVVSRNLEAARALLAAGANPFYNDNEMPFEAVKINTSEQRVVFPDYRLGNALLVLWLEQGGDPNATHRGASLGPLLSSTPVNNLEAILLLLGRDADPWLTAPVYSTGTDKVIFQTEPFHLTNANAAPISSEIAFRVARAGHYSNTPAEGVDDLIRLYERTAAQYVGSSGPTNLHTVWCMQMALREILPQIGRAPQGDIARLLDMDIPDDIGGFFLGPDEIRSPDDPDQLVNNLNQFGNERWDDR